MIRTIPSIGNQRKRLMVVANIRNEPTKAGTCEVYDAWPVRIATSSNSGFQNE